MATLEPLQYTLFPLPPPPPPPPTPRIKCMLLFPNALGTMESLFPSLCKILAQTDCILKH